MIPAVLQESHLRCGEIWSCGSNGFDILRVYQREQRVMASCLDLGWAPCMAWHVFLGVKLISIWVEGKKGRFFSAVKMIWFCILPTGIENLPNLGNFNSRLNSTVDHKTAMAITQTQGEVLLQRSSRLRDHLHRSWFILHLTDQQQEQNVSCYGKDFMPIKSVTAALGHIPETALN